MTIRSEVYYITVTTSIIITINTDIKLSITYIYTTAGAAIHMMINKPPGSQASG